MSTPPLTPTTSGITETTDGNRVIPSSLRADGTTRKEIKIRPGYRPPEDVAVYKNRNAQAFQARGKDWKDGVPGAVMDDDGGDDDSGKPASANAIKNAKRKAAKKKAKESADAPEVGGAKAGGEKAGAGGGGKKVEKATGEDAGVAAAAPSAEVEVKLEGMTEEEKEKQIKSIKKKLRQAQDLKQKKANGDSLIPDQLEKITRIIELTRQLEALGVKE